MTNASNKQKSIQNTVKDVVLRSNIPRWELQRKAPDFSAKRMVSELSSQVEAFVHAGWQPSIISFMFMPLPGKRSTMLKIMNSEVELFYSKLVTRVDRNPTAPSHFRWLPRLYVAPDFPVYKH